MNGDSEPASLFAVVFYSEDPSFSILQLDTLGNLEDLKEHVVSFDVASFEDPCFLPIRLSVSPPTSSTGDLYLFPARYSAGIQALHGYKFDFSTGSFQNICLPPYHPLQKGHISSAVSVAVHTIQISVRLGGLIYRLVLHTIPLLKHSLVESLFDCYDPVNDSWKPLKPFPPSECVCIVLATAVLGDTDTILLNVYPSGLWAYDVCGNEWYFVEFNDPRCLGIEGDAVAIGNTIYALTGRRSDVVLALSIEKNNDVFHCCVRSEIPIPDLRSPFTRDDVVPWVTSTNLVHLGNVDFCLVRSCSPLTYEHSKPILVTYMRLTGETEMTVLSNHWFKTRHTMLSQVVLCFSLPKCKTAALEEGNRFVFELDP